MKVTAKIYLLFIILKTTIFSSPEEAFIEIEMKGEKNEFYRILMDYETDKLYLGIGEFMDFMKIETLKFDKKRLRIKGSLDEENQIDISLKKNEIIELEDDIFLELEDLKKYFKISGSNWDDERYVLSLQPAFKTPREYQDVLNNRRSLIAMNKKNQEMEEQKEYIKSKKQFISPGILKFSYDNNDFEKNDYYIDLDYGTELFYGEFEVSQKIYPESDLDYIRLQYKEIFGEYYLTFGDFYLESDSIFNVERNLRGVSFSKNEYYGVRTDNRTLIEGEVYNARFVELYRNGNLDDFQIISDGQFRFEPLTMSSSDRYTIKIYYRDGREESKDIYVLGDQNILKKGDTDFLVQMGKGNDYKKNQYLSKFKYGLTKNITTSLGTSFLENRDSKEYNVLEAGMAYKFGIEEYPTLLSGTLLEEFNSNDLNFKSILEQKLPYNMNLIFRYEKYSNQTAERLSRDYSYNIDLSKSFRRTTASVGYFKNSYEDDNLYQIYLNLDYTLSRNIRVSLSNEYYESVMSNIISYNSKGYGSQIKINYSGIDGLGAILQGKINYEEDKIIDDEIRLSLIKSPSENGILKNIDTSFDIGHSREKGTFFEMRLTYIFDNNIYIEFPDITTEDKKTKIGGRVEKSFYLGNPLLPINNNDVTHGWVEGKVFVDENANGVMDENESIYEGAEVNTSGGTAIVKENGKYIIGNINNVGLHTIDINRESIDPMLIQGKDIIKYKGSTSSGVVVDIPLVPVSMISGYIQSDKTVEERRYDGLIANLDVLLKKGNEEIKRSATEIDGYYFFEDILPGEYTVEIVPNSRRYKGDFDKKELKVEVKTGREGDYYEDNNFVIKSIELIEDEILEDVLDTEEGLKNEKVI